MAQRKPTKAELEYAKKRSAASGIPMDVTKKQLKGTSKKIINAAKTAALSTGVGKAGAVVGKVAGAAVARSLAKEASPKILKAANAARGSGKTVNPKPAMGKIERTAAKRDVVVRTEDKTLATNGFISKKGYKSVKVNSKNPRVRTIEKEVSSKTASNRTKSSNKLRYGSSKAEAKRGREAIESSEKLRKAGSKIFGASGAASGAAAANAKKKKGK